ncbi:MAG TPA: ABC transporter permease [Thermoanaerobaculia bacterium]|nr:ABC transporter permease [Thermoanaerobaculia bacterium]
MSGLGDFVWQRRGEILALTGEHVLLVAAAAVIAAAIGVPLGVALTRRPSLARPVLGFANTVQAIPSLALFGFLIPVPWIGGIGARTAIVALVVYSLLPILRNTHAGILAVDPAVLEAADGMGMTEGQRLRSVELPLAFPVVLAGIRVAVVVGVGLATIAAAIGAGGLGVLIYRGVATADHRLILAGAVPAACLALAFDFGLGLVERRLGPRR